MRLIAGLLVTVLVAVGDRLSRGTTSFVVQ
jgi:hypothetical protein